jgi:hypothetical protein
MKAKGARLAVQLTDDNCIIVGAQGVSEIDRKTMAKLTTEGQWELKQCSFDQANDSSVWIRRDGAWLRALHTESLAGDPDGRDRRA